MVNNTLKYQGNDFLSCPPSVTPPALLLISCASFQTFFVCLLYASKYKYVSLCGQIYLSFLNGLYF